MKHNGISSRTLGLIHGRVSAHHVVVLARFVADEQRHAKAYLLQAICATLAVSASGYQAWKRGGAPNRKRLADSQMLARIRAIHAELKGAYGSPGRVKEIWWGADFRAGKERGERLMRENNIRGRHKRRFKATTD